MTVTVTEQFDSRPQEVGSSNEVTLDYVIQGTSDDYTAHVNLLATVPVNYITPVSVLVLDKTHVERISDYGWHGTATYAPPSPASGNDEYTFETGGSTQHIDHSLATSARYAPPGKVAPNFKQAIGVTDSTVDGVDITAPIYNFSETHEILDTVVTAAYKATLFMLTGRVNNYSFKGFAAGEVLFLGANGNLRTAENWTITYRFSASQNITNIKIGDITGIDKLGWEYLWVRYAEEADSAAKRLAKRPIAAYVEQIYYPGDFSLIGIGV